jgi:hypothetical protein
MADKTFDEISRWVFRNVKKGENTKCFRCKKELLGYDVKGYEHDGGWKTKRGLQWLYIECPCGYQNSFSKMRISHDIDFSKVKD